VTGVHPEIGYCCGADDRNAVGGHGAQAAPRSGGRGIEAGAREDLLGEVREVADAVGPECEIEAGEFRGAGDAGGVADWDDRGVHVIVDDRNAERATGSVERNGITLRRANGYMHAERP